MRWGKQGVICLIALMLLFGCVFPAAAETYQPGDTLEAVFTVTENPQEAVGIRAQLRYDHDALELIPSKAVPNDMIMLIDWEGIPVGKTVTASFRVLPDAPDGTYQIDMELLEANNSDLEDVTGSVRMSSVSVDVAAHGKDYEYAIENNEVTIKKYIGQDSYVVIPETIEGKKVTRIGMEAFKFCRSLTNVMIPSSVNRIEFDAFYGCSSLASVTIPSSVTKIGEHVFFWCSSLTSVTIPSGITVISDHAFSGCSSLKSVAIPNSVMTIGSYAFSGCSSLTNITIPGSVTSIYDSAFSGCSSLTDITIPNSVTNIGWSAFSNCSKLTVTVEKGSYAEQYCKEQGIKYTSAGTGNDGAGSEKPIVTASVESSLAPISIWVHYVNENGEQVASDTAVILEAGTWLVPATPYDLQPYYELNGAGMKTVTVDCDGAHPGEVTFVYYRHPTPTPTAQWMNLSVKLSVKQGKNTSVIRFDWDDIDDAVQYKVYCLKYSLRNNKNSKFQLCKTTTNSEYKCPGNNIVPSGLRKNTRYIFYVEAEDKYGNVIAKSNEEILQYK